MFDELLRANRTYASEFSLQGIASRAAKGFALVTCMDSRIEPLAMLGLRPGDAKILRNAGARVTRDVLRSLALATAFLCVTEIAVMQHVDCALARTSDDDIVNRLPSALAANCAGWELLAMEDPDEALRTDVEAVRACQMLPGGVRVEGWRYDEGTGLIRRVIVA